MSTQTNATVSDANQNSSSSNNTFQTKYPLISTWIAQEDALLNKNVLVLARRKFTLFILLFAPGLLILLLSILNDEVMKEHVISPLTEHELLPTRCKVFNFRGQIDEQNPSCVTIMYGPSNPTTDSIMKIFTKNAGIKSREANRYKGESATDRNIDWVIKTGVAKSGDIHFVADVIGMKDNTEIAKFMRAHLGRLDTALFFDTKSDPTGGTYTLMVNGTVVGPYGYRANEPWHHVGIQNLLNEAIVSHYGDTINVDVTIKPIRDLQEENANVDGSNEQYDDVQSMIPTTGHLFIVMGTLIGALIVINTVTGEKRARIVGIMRMMGLHESAYWMSWMIILWLLSFVTAAISATCGALTPIKIFKNCDWSVHFVAFFFFFTSMHSMALCISSIVRRMNWVNIFSFSLFTFAVTFSSVANNNSNGTFWNYAYSPVETVFWKIIFFLMPWFHYNKIFNNILSITKVQGLGLGETSSLVPTGFASQDAIQAAQDSNTSTILNVTENSTYYKWENIYDPIGLSTGEPFPVMYDINGDPIGGTWYAPSVHESMMYMFALNAIYFIVAWYLAQILSSDLGAAKKPWFLFDLKFWGFSRGTRTFIAGDRIGQEQVLSKTQHSLRIYKMSKAFKNVTALKELSLTMKNNQVFCLLGHNGAGKTTTINCLTGLYNPTFGEAFVFGHSVKDEITQVQKLMGVCPQHDVLFNELTANEHLRFWARFKGIPRKELDIHVTQTLKDISLEGNGKNLASTFSGGMKRRLSVGMSAMGNPKVIFLDEPTTGLDPLSRRRVWTMIERLKQGRIIVLTTHSMEEADALSDEIGILSNGRLRALGSAFFLKNKFGSGYTITLMCDESDTEQVIAMTKQKLPGAETLANAAGALSFGLPKRVLPLIPNFFADIEAEAKELKEKALIKEWGISNTRLEEVFLRLVAQNKELNASAGGNADDSFDANDAIMVKRSDGVKIISTKTLEDGVQKDFEPVDLYSSVGAPLIISQQLYRLLGEGGEQKDDEKDHLLGHNNVDSTDFTGDKNANGDDNNNAVNIAQQQQTMMEIKIPHNAGPGMTLQMTTPDGQTIQIMLPKGVTGGQFIHVPYTPLPAPFSTTSTNSDNIGNTDTYTNAHNVMNELSPASSVGGYKQQIYALYCKDAAMQRRMKWSNCCRCCCMVFISLIMLLVSAILEGARTNQKRLDIPGNCNGGLSLVQDGAGQLPGRSFDLCNDTDWNDYIVGGKCKYREDCSLRKKTAIYSMPSSIPKSTSINQGIQSGKANMFMNYTDAPDFCILSNTMYNTGQVSFEKGSSYVPKSNHRFVRIWIENKKTVTDPISINGLVNVNNSNATVATLPWWYKFQPNDKISPLLPENGKNNANSRADGTNTGNAGSSEGSDGGLEASLAYQMIDFCKGINITFHDGIEAKLVLNQQLIQSREIPNTKLDCTSTKQDPDMVYENVNGMEAAINEFETLFPDYAVTFDKSERSGSFKNKDLNLKLKYAIHTFASHKGSWDDYKWARIFYGTNTGNDKRGKVCNQVKMFSFVPSDYWVNNFIIHYQQRVGIRRRATPELPYMFLSTQILNGLLFDNRKGMDGGLQIKPQITGMPIVRYPQAGLNTFQLFLMLLAFPVVTMLFFPILVQNVSLEMREKLVLAIRLQSGRLVAYWIATYLFHYTLYFGGTCLFVGFQALIGNQLFVNCNIGQLIAVLIFWGHAQIGMGVFLAMLLSRTRLQMLSAYVMMLLVMIMAPMLWSARLSEWGAGLWIFPPTAFIRGITLVLEHSAQPNTIVQSCGHMFWTGCVLGAIGIVIHYASMNEDQGTSLFNIHHNMCRKLKHNDLAKVAQTRKTDSAENALTATEDETTVFMPSNNIKDEDVLKEEKRVQSLDVNATAIKLVNLRKVFHQTYPRKVAVNNVTLGINTGEVFGLLGPNGAGKTTTIHMLSGHTLVTDGHAFIGGYDVRDRKVGLTNVRKIIGLCPQFDTVWPTLTVQEHLLLYARLKGVSRQRERAVAQSVAAQVELSGDAYYQQASQLSGGMRRRLSLGIALVGNPKIVFLDEPTTGLDPETKMGVWRIIERLKVGRAIVLTTHSMEEADALSSRIGIMANGRLRCIGSQLHLKNKFGSGYRLAMTLKKNVDATSIENTVDSFVKSEISSNATRLDEEHAHGTIVYNIKEGTVNISDTFKVMEQKRKEFINEWSLQQTSLESVFLRIAKAAEAAEANTM